MLLFAVDEHNDVYLNGNGQIARVDGVQALRQKIRERLKLFLAEWFLNTNRGVPYFQNILGEDINQSIAAQILTNEIYQEPEVLSIFDVRFSLDRNTRGFSYSARINSIYTSFNLEVKQ